jgi:DNA-binding beta-propeller fold protein YncE
VDKDSGSRFASINDADGSISLSASFDITGPVADFVLDPAGDVVHALLPQGVSARRFEFGGALNSDISLTALWGTSFPTGVAPSQLALDPTGRVLVVAFDGNGLIASYRLDRARLRRTTGPSAASLASQAALYITGGVTVSDIAIDMVGGYVLSTLSAQNELRLLPIDASGALRQPSQGRASGLVPIAVEVTEDGQHVYVLNALSRTITQYSGAPNYARVADFPASTQEFVPGESDLAVDKTGRWLFVSNTLRDAIDIWTIAPGTGALSRAWTVATPSPGPLSLRHRVQ